MQCRACSRLSLIKAGEHTVWPLVPAIETFTAALRYRRVRVGVLPLRLADSCLDIEHDGCRWEFARRQHAQKIAGVL